MKNISLKGNVEDVDISDLETTIERAELGLRVSKMEQIHKILQSLRFLSIIHLGTYVCHPASSLSDQQMMGFIKYYGLE